MGMGAISHEEFLNRLTERQPISSKLYSVTGEYINSLHKVTCKCNICEEEWEGTPQLLLSGSGCPKCNGKNNTSLFEQVIYRAFKEVLGDDKVLHRDKSLIGKELDVYIPSLKTAFEPGSWGYHKDKTWSDYDKYLLCKEKGVNLITIYDDMGNDFNLDFDYNVTKYKNDISVNQIVSFVKKYLTKYNLNSDINWEKIFIQSKTSTAGKTTDEFKEQVSKVNLHLEVVGEYINHRERIEVRCKFCGHAFKNRPYEFLHLYSCPKCGKSEEYIPPKPTYNEKFLIKFKEKNPETYERIEILEEVKRGDQIVLCRCKICNNEYKIKANGLIYTKNGCICEKCREMVCDICGVDYKFSKNLGADELYKTKNKELPSLCPKCRKRIKNKLYEVNDKTGANVDLYDYARAEIIKKKV